MDYILEMKDISKTFPGVKALDHVQLQVRPGEVHALMGENGAGKSTLMKILMGIYTKDEGGEILFNGQPYQVSNPKEAMDRGVAMIHQELNPILDMPVYENIFVGREIRKKRTRRQEGRDRGVEASDRGMRTACFSDGASAQPDRSPVPADRDHQSHLGQRESHHHG